MEAVHLLTLGMAFIVLAAIFRQGTTTRRRDRTTIRVSDAAVARRALIDHADAFSNRPTPAFSAGRPVTHSIASMPYGPVWQTLRRNLTANILHHSRLGDLAQLEREAAVAAASILSAEAGSGDVVVVPRDTIHGAVLTLFARVLQLLRCGHGIGAFVDDEAPTLAAAAAPSGGAKLEVAVPPGGAPVSFVLGDIGRDGKVWTKPDKFRPERFLEGGEGEGVSLVPGPKEIKMMPFGTGRRHCSGVAMGMAHVKCFLAELVRGLEWVPPADDGGGIDFTEIDGFIKWMKTPLRVRIAPRSMMK
ncbi:unnamed protein product [Urochloa decumbens]|uniref:Cytochrome P450 n=1 Tax=Urochloa decumbens TaxID=240449 RepID=A0ABC9DCH3_9POAL